MLSWQISEPGTHVGMRLCSFTNRLEWGNESGDFQENILSQPSCVLLSEWHCPVTSKFVCWCVQRTSPVFSQTKQIHFGCCGFQGSLCLQILVYIRQNCPTRVLKFFLWIRFWFMVLTYPQARIVRLSQPAIGMFVSLFYRQNSAHQIPDKNSSKELLFVLVCFWHTQVVYRWILPVIYSSTVMIALSVSLFLEPRVIPCFPTNNLSFTVCWLKFAKIHRKFAYFFSLCLPDWPFFH